MFKRTNNFPVSASYGRVKRQRKIRKDFASKYQTNLVKEFIQVGGEVLNKPFINWILSRDLGEVEHSRFKRRTRGAEFTINHNFAGTPNLMDLKNSIDNSYEASVKYLLKGAKPSDIYFVEIRHEDLSPPLFIPPQRVRDFDKTRFLNQLDKVYQSNQSFLNSGVLEVRVMILDSLEGKGRGNKPMTTITNKIARKQSVIKIRNEDNSCGYRVVYLAVYYTENGVKGKARNSFWSELIRRETLQRRSTNDYFIKLTDTTGVQFKEGNEWKTFDSEMMKIIEGLIGYQIIVIEGKKQVYRGEDREKVIYMLKDGDHFDLIKSMTGYFNRALYCKYCNRSFNQPNKHLCIYTCKFCRSPKTCPITTKRVCADCKVRFPSDQCYNKHKKNKICKYRHYCERCEVTFDVEKKRSHVCEEIKCDKCHDYFHEQPHYCYIKPLDKVKLAEEDQKNNIVVIFDIESCLEDCGKFKEQVPILLIAKIECNKCLESDVCEICGTKERRFYDENCVSDFVKYILSLAETAKKCWITVVAHNNSGYDGQFVMKELILQKVTDIKPVMNGTKIMVIDSGNVRFMDSYLLLQSPLAELPKMFGFEEEEKGFFPYNLCTIENLKSGLEYSRLGDINPEEFGRNNMKVKRVKDFDLWYDDHKEEPYDLNERLETYCEQDVEILQKAFRKFRNDFKAKTSLDPISRSFTLASIGMETFRALYLKPNTIGITPKHGYSIYGGRQSKEGNAWLDIIEERNLEIGPLIREYRIGSKSADGVILSPLVDNGVNYRGIAFEYNGCYSHGHDCGDYFDQKKFNKVEKRKELFMKMGVFPHFVWSCEYKESVSAEEWKVFQERTKYHKNMEDNHLYCNPRKAYSGGRVNNFMFKYIPKKNEEIKYLDFTSLYPFVMARKPYPVGHPIVYRNNFPELEDIFGFVSCKVLPPRNLYLPVLPYNNGKKLYFTLCRTCADKQSDNCKHSEDERCLTNTFVSEELKLARRKGYEIVEWYEVLHYPNKSTDLFKEYVEDWCKTKTEASGWPSNCTTIEQKGEYIRGYREAEGVELDPNNITPNPGYRSMAKLMQNCLYGKFGQRPDMVQTKVVVDCAEYLEMHDPYHPTIELLGEVDIGDASVISFRVKNLENVGNTSVAIAGFVTTYGRIELQDVMDVVTLTGNLLYCDTDSVVYTQLINRNIGLKLGMYLGQLKDEIVEGFGVGAKISEFYSVGPKFYRIIISTPTGYKEIFKVKGVTQNLAALTILTKERMIEMAENKINDKPSPLIQVPQTLFRRNRFHEVWTQEILKQIRVTSDKRIAIGNDTLPYGYIEP